MLVVLETDWGNSTTAPASLSYGSQTLVRAVTATTANVYRNVSIFYLFNPAPGTRNITGTANNASVWLSAYTLNGVDTNSPPLTGSVVTGGDTSVNFGVSGVPAAAWATVNGVYANDTTYDSMGYIANLGTGAPLKTAMTTASRGRAVLRAAAFVYLGGIYRRQCLPDGIPGRERQLLCAGGLHQPAGLDSHQHQLGGDKPLQPP